PVRRLARLDGRLTIEGLPDTAPAGGESAVIVVLENHGSETWPATALDSGDRFALDVRWDGIDATGAPTSLEERLALPADVPAGGTARATVWLALPTRPGRYRIAVAAGQGDFPFPFLAEPAPLRWDGMVDVRRSAAAPAPAGAG
ncbi:MAG: hypothetical protein ACREQL_11920, partial [Candidatus Binatia bacterium]